jgi:hypothetical protein
MKPPKPTKKQLRHRIKEAVASQVHTYYFAESAIDKVSIDHLLGSGVLLELHFIGGKEAVLPVMIKDGLSAATIDAIKADLARSYSLATAFKPKGVI